MAPLLVGDSDNDRLVAAVRSLPAASQVLETERNRPNGFIDVERLMTRLHESEPVIVPPVLSKSDPVAPRHRNLAFLSTSGLYK